MVSKKIKATITEMTQFIYKSLNDSKNLQNSLFRYFEAFDTVDHNILLPKLNKLGLRNKALWLFSSYLKGCQLTVCFLSLAHAQHRQNTFAQNRFFYVFK